MSQRKQKTIAPAEVAAKRTRTVVRPYSVAKGSELFETPLGPIETTVWSVIADDDKVLSAHLDREEAGAACVAANKAAREEHSVERAHSVQVARFHRHCEAVKALLSPAGMIPPAEATALVDAIDRALMLATDDE